MRRTISLIFAAGLLASGIAAAAETTGTAHVGGRHDGGGHAGNGHVMRGDGGHAGGGHAGRGGGGKQTGNFRNRGIRYGVGVGLGGGVPYYAGNPGVDSYDGYDDSGDDAAPTDTDPDAYGSDEAPDDPAVSPAYYCDNPQGYYPDVTLCNDDWQSVQAAPPGQ